MNEPIKKQIFIGGEGYSGKHLKKLYEREMKLRPKIIYKLGDPESGYLPTEQDLADFKILLQQQAHDPLASIIVHTAAEAALIKPGGWAERLMKRYLRREKR